MSSLNLVSTRLADAPPTDALYEYIVAGNGLFVRAEDSRIAACIPLAYPKCRGLATVETYARLKLPRISGGFLKLILENARRKLPDESAYQFVYRADHWVCIRPEQQATPSSVDYADIPEAVIDLHSHAEMGAFFSGTDDQDEGGLRFYIVIGNVGDVPTIKARVGVYGHRWPVPVSTLFDSLYIFVEEKDGRL